MKLRNIISLITLCIILLASCSNDSTDSAILKNGTLQITDKANTWTYVSLEKGLVVGTCTLGDSVSEKTWKTRTDWDIAICNGMIRTNSGTSGNGSGGITSTSSSFETSDIAPEKDYQVDSDTIQIW